MGLEVWKDKVLVATVEDYDVVDYVEQHRSMLGDLLSEHCDCSDEIDEALSDRDSDEGLTRDDRMVAEFESAMDTSMPNERDNLFERIQLIARRFSVRGA